MLRSFFKKISSIGYLLFAIGLMLLSACWRPPGFGIGGRYLDAKAQIVKQRGDLDKAISSLEYVVIRDPLYQDSLTLLGRAYYRKGRYQDALQILQRALTVNKEDEVAWITLGLTQLRLGDDMKGLEALKGGLTLFSKASKDGYKGIEFWDKNGLVRIALGRAVFAVTKGLENREGVIRSAELLLTRVDDEEWLGRVEQFDKATRTDQ